MSGLSSRTIGVLQILLSGFCFGFLGVFGKYAYAAGLTPGELLSLRFTLAGLILFGLFLVVRPARLRMLPRQRLWSILLGVFGYAVFSYCYFVALKGLSASLTVLLLYLYPVMVPVFARVVLQERIPRTRLFLLPLAMAGLAMLVWGDFYVTDPTALAFGFGSALFYALYIVLSRRQLEGADGLASTAHVQLAAGLTLGAFHWRDPQRLGEVVAVAWPYILGLAVICSILAMSLFLLGLMRLKSWEASILSTAEPVTGIAFAYLVLGERLTTLQSCGAALVMIVLLLLSLPERFTAPRSL